MKTKYSYNDEIYLPSSLFSVEYDVYSMVKEEEQRYYREQSDKFLKKITSKPRRKKKVK